MHRDKLVQYRELKREISKLKDRLENEKSKIVQDKVVGSSSEYPYNIVHFNIEGMIYDDEYTRELYKILSKRYNDSSKLKLEIEVWIANIPDSRTRQVFEMRYIEGASWLRISTALGSQDESFARKIHNRYLKK